MGGGFEPLRPYNFVIENTGLSQDDEDLINLSLASLTARDDGSCEVVFQSWADKPSPAYVFARIAFIKKGTTSTFVINQFQPTNERGINRCARRVVVEFARVQVLPFDLNTALDAGPQRALERVILTGVNYHLMATK